MASPDVLKSISKKLKYYLEIQRLEDGFDLSGPDCPRMDHPPIRARSALLYSGLHDRPLKHYFHHPSVRRALTQFKTADEKNSEDQEEIRRSVVKYMEKYRFNSRSLTDECYGYDSRAGRRLRPEVNWRGTPLVRGRMPYSDGNRVLRSVPPSTVSRTETKRLLDSACQLVVAAESGLNCDPESAQQEKQEGNAEHQRKNNKENKADHKDRKDKPSDDRSANKPSRGRESTLVKRSHGDKSVKQNRGKHQSSCSDEEDNAQQRSSCESGNKHRKAATHNVAAEQHHKTTDVHSKQPQKTSTKEQPKEQRKTTPSDVKFSGRTSSQPSRAKTAKYRSPTCDDGDDKPPLRNPRSKRLTRSYDQFSSTVESGTQTSGELLKHYDPSEQVLKEGAEAKYHVDVQTGKCTGAGTKADIQVVLIGDLGRTEYLPLSTALTPHKIRFKRNQRDLFEVFCPSVGNLKQIKIGHNMKQAEYKWYVENVTVQDLTGRMEYRIPCQKWLSGAFGDRETFGEFAVKSSSTFSADDVDSMDYHPEETYIAMRDSRTAEVTDENDDTSDDSQSDSSSSIDEDELKIPVSPMTPRNPETTGKRGIGGNDDFFDQRLRENDYGSIIESIVNNPSDYENNNSVAPKVVVSKVEDRGNETTDGSDADMESRSAAPHQLATPAEVYAPNPRQKRRSASRLQRMLDAVRFGSYSDVLRLAEKHPELLEQTGDGEYTAVHVAALCNRREILTWLTSRVADVDRESKGGHTALQLAAMNGHVDCLKVLFDMGAKLNYRGSSGLTALHLAARVGQGNSVRWLLENGADRTVRIVRGSKPVDLGKEFNQNDIIQFISSEWQKMGVKEGGAKRQMKD